MQVVASLKAAKEDAENIIGGFVRLFRSKKRLKTATVNDWKRWQEAVEAGPSEINKFAKALK